MDEGYRLRWQLVVLADAIAIAICLLLIYEYVGFEGAGILPTVVCPIMSVIASIGVVMWANGSGAKFTNGPKWETMMFSLKRVPAVRFLHLPAPQMRMVSPL